MADNAQEETEDQECPICYEPLNGSLFKQPICGHAYHEKCWHNHLLTYKGDPVRCQRCLQPVDQKAVGWILKEISRLGPGLPTDETRPVVEELLNQLVALGDSGLLEGEATTRAALTEEGTLRTTAHAVLFARYVLALLEEADRCPDTFDHHRNANQLAFLRGPGRIVDLAALIWDKEPEATVRFPCIARLLNLENSTGEAHFLLGKLLFAHQAFRDLGRATTHLCEAWRQEHPDVVSWMLKEVPQLGAELVTEENRVKVKELLTQLVALGESGLLEGEAMTRAALTEEGTLRTTAHAVLFAHYVLALLREADQCPDTFDCQKHAKQLDVLREPDQIVDLAALIWDKEPEAAVRFPCIARLLNLENSTAEAHFRLGRLCSETRGVFENFDRAKRHLREALQQHHPGAAAALLKLFEELGEDAELREVCEQLLSIDRNHAEANYQLGKLYLKQDNLELAELHLRRAFDSGRTQALYDLGEAFQNRGALNKAQHCFWDLHHSAFSREEDCRWARWAKDAARTALAKFLYREGARQDSLRLALIRNVAWYLERRNSKQATSRLRDSMYWEPAMAALHDIEARGAVALLPEVEQYFGQGCHDLTEGILEKLLGFRDDSVLLVLGWGYEEQSQLRKAARCYRKVVKLCRDLPADRLVADMSLVHLRWKLQDPRARQEITAVKAKIPATTLQAEWSWLDGPKKLLDELEAISFRTAVPKSIRALFFEDAAPLQPPAAAEEPLPLADAPRNGSAPHQPPPAAAEEPLPAGGGSSPPANPPHQPPPAAAEEPLPPRMSPVGASSAPANPPQQPARVVPPASASLGQGDGERDLQSQPLPAPPLRPQPLRLAQDTLDDQDPNFQAALLLICAEQRDQLLAARTNPVLMRAQRQLLQPVPEEPEQGEKLFLLHFQRSSPEFKARLHQGPLLAPCRAALEAAGLPWLLEDETGHTGTFVGHFGVKVFVHPNQYQIAREALSQLLSQQPPKRLFPRHMVVAESLLPLLLESLKGCPGTTLKPNGQVELGEVLLPPVTAESNDPTESLSTSTDPLRACLHVANMGEQKTFLNTPAAMHHGQVAHSDGPPSANPRRRKARSSRSSKSRAAPEESTASPLGPGTKSTGAATSLRRQSSSCGDQAADNVVSGIPQAQPGVPAAGAMPGDVQGPTKETTQPGFPVPLPAAAATPGVVQGPQTPMETTAQPGFLVPSPAAAATPGAAQEPQHSMETGLLSVEALGQPTSGCTRSLPPPAPAATNYELPASPREAGSSPAAAPATPAPAAQEDIQMQLATSSVAEGGSSLPAPPGTNQQLPTSPVEEATEDGSSMPAPRATDKQLATSPVAEAAEVGSSLPGTPGTTAASSVKAGAGPLPCSSSPTPPGTAAASSLRAGAGPLPCSSSPAPLGTAAAPGVRAGAGPLPCSRSPTPPSTTAVQGERRQSRSRSFAVQLLFFTGLMAGVAWIRGPAFGAGRGHAIRHGDGQE